MSKIDENKIYDQNHYRKFILRLRRDSELLTACENYLHIGEYTLNFLMCKLLAEFFGCEPPHKQYTRFERKQIYPPPSSAVKVHSASRDRVAARSDLDGANLCEREN